MKVKHAKQKEATDYDWMTQVMPRKKQEKQGTS
jgi:hypothetical protein